MRRQIARRQRFGAPRAREVPLPLPTGGLFGDAATAEIAGQYAARLENLRSTGVSVETLAPHTLGDAEETAVARFPFEFGGAAQYVEAKQSQTEAAGKTLPRRVLDGADYGYLSANIIIADGNGLPVRFNGTKLFESVWTASDGTAPEFFDGFTAHHDRPYFWRYNSGLDFYYGEIGAVTGDLTRFPLGRLGNITGEIAAIQSMTQDASENLNDSLVVVTTTGWAVIYEGTNPGDAQNWRQAGRVRVAPPISKDAFAEVAGDLWMVTRAGVVSILDSLRRGQLALASNLARPIKKEVERMIAAGGEFQLHMGADGEQIIFHRYQYDFTSPIAEQVIYHPSSQTWSTARYPARRFHNLDGKTQFTTQEGRLGTIGGDGEATITATWHTGWLRLKRGSGIAWIQPTIIAKGPLTFTITVLTDHDTTAQDIADATQEVTIEPDDPADPEGTVALNEVIPIGVSGQTYQLRMSFTAIEAEMTSLVAGVL